MKLFVIYEMESDTCGNTDYRQSRFVFAEDIEKVWTHLNQPRVVSYRVGDKWIARYKREVANPDFDFGRDIHKATGFESGGFGGFRVEEMEYTRL